MSEADKRNRPFPTSQKGDKIDHGTDALAEMNVNRRVLDSPKDGPHKNWDDGQRKDHRTAERKEEKPTVL